MAAACLNCGRDIESSGRRARLYCDKVCGQQYRKGEGNVIEAAPLLPRACRCEGAPATFVDEDGDRRCIACGHERVDGLAVAA